MAVPGFGAELELPARLCPGRTGEERRECERELIGRVKARADLLKKKPRLLKLSAGRRKAQQQASTASEVPIPKASKKKRKKSLFAVELKPFAYTKIVIEKAEGKKSKNRLVVRVLEDGEEIRTRTIEL